MTNATLRGKPDAGNPHVRFDEGEVAPGKPRRGSLLYKGFGRLGLAGAIALAGVAARAEVVTTNVTYDSAYTWTVASGVTDEMQGCITAASTFTKAGAGTLVLSNSGNTFGGDIAIGGVLRADAEGALGTARILIPTTSSSGPVLQLNAAGAEFANDIDFTGSTQSRPLPLQFLQSCTLNGNLLFRNGGKPFYIGDDSTVRPTVVFNGTVKHPRSASGNSFTFYSSGTWKFNGVVTASTLQPYSSSADKLGTVEFHAVSNDIGCLTLIRPAVHLYAEDALSNTSVKWNYNGGGEATVDSLGQLWLHADQHVACFTWGAAKYPSSTAGCQIYADKPVTLTIAGDSSAPIAYCRLNNEISLVMDGVDGTIQVLSGRAHATTGSIAVRGGTLRLAGETTFKNVPELLVAGGTLDVQSSAASAFAGVTNLTVSSGTLNFGSSAATPFADRIAAVAIGSAGAITSDATLVINAGAFYANGSSTPAGYGIFSASTHPGLIGENVSIVVERPEHVYTADSWVGTSGGDVATAGNWSANAVPDFTSGDFTAFFGADGDWASVATAIAVRGLIFSATNYPSFTLAKGGDSGAVTLGESGIAVDAVPGADGNAVRAYTNAVPLVLNSTEQTWDVPENATLAIVGGITANGSPAVTKTGLGDLALSGEYAAAGDLTLSGGTTALRGTVGTDADAGTLTVYSDSAHLACLHLDGVSINKKVVNFGSGSSVNSDWLKALANTTNVFTKLYQSNGSQFFTFESASEMTFTGGIEIAGYFLAQTKGGAKNARMVIRDNPLRITAKNKGSVSLWANVVFDAVGNEIADNLSTPGKGLYLEFRRDAAMASCAKLTLNGGEIRLNATRQAWPKVTSRYSTIIVGDAGSQFEITEGQTEAEIAEAYGQEYSAGHLNARFTGGVSLKMSGAGVTLVTNSVNASCGDVTVTNGILRFAADASWLNGTNVTVCGAGRLETNGNGTFGSQCVLALADDGVIAISSGKRFKVAAATVDGAALSPGRYDYATAPAEVRRHLTEDGGSLYVPGEGLTVIVR